jgi:predicted nucleic acid-binding Zn ribbon protein|tara:strand:+ start:525 stop:695 length:171 start_codon:yes stop_codon:yes gene_type:complete
MATLTVKDVRAKIETHEAVCAERWKETIERIKRLELVMISSAGAVILLMAGMLWKM